MGKKEKLNAIVAGAGKNAKNLLNKAVQVVDQTDDGKFDFADIAVIAEGVGNAVKKVRRNLKHVPMKFFSLLNFLFALFLV